MMDVIAARQQIHQAVKKFPTISTPDELRELEKYPYREGIYLFADRRIFKFDEYRLERSMWRVQKDELFAGPVRVLWIP